MGLGKSISTLTAISDMQESFDVDKVLVIAPKRVARKTWSDEAKAWEHVSHLTFNFILGTAAQRLAGIESASNADITTINRENVDWLFKQFVTGTGKKQKLIRKWPWDVVVLDESSSFKNQSSQRWKALRKLRKFFDRCIQLTGTPAPNGYRDLWSQMALLDRGQRLGRTEKAFKERWMDSPNRYDPASKWEFKGPWAQRQIEEAVSDIAISMRAEDYLDLPPVTYNPVAVTLSRKEMTSYKEMERKFCMELEGQRITAVNAGVLAGKLLQLASGAAYFDDKGNYEILHDRKIDATLELLGDINAPAMMGYNYKSEKARLLKVLGPWAKKNKKIVRSLETEEDENAWNRGEIDVLLLHPASAGHGINIHKCDCETIILFGLNWSLELYQQLNARIAGGHRRIGKNVIIHHIIAEDTIDMEVMARLEYKDCTQNMLTEAVKAHIQEILS